MTYMFVRLIVVITWAVVGLGIVVDNRVDSDFDQKILDAFVDGLFTPYAYNVDFELVPSIVGSQSLGVPDGTKMDHFLSWVQQLPDREPPSWLSLPPTA